MTLQLRTSVLLPTLVSIPDSTFQHHRHNVLYLPIIRHNVVCSHLLYADNWLVLVVLCNEKMY